MNFEFAHLFDSPEKILFFALNAIVVLSVFSVIVAVSIDFSEFHQRNGTKKEKKSIVETGGMFLFFFLFYFLLRSGMGSVSISIFPLRVFLGVFGLFLMILGALVNIKGRFDLGKNWSNQIKIYTDHTFVQTGCYGFVRHPLYASLIWMFFGASFVYANIFAFCANVFVFLPFMFFRAKQEEALLAQEFEEYKKYQKKVGMFFPLSFSKK